MNRWDIRKIITTLLMTGFLGGIVYGNIIGKEYILSMGILNEYILERYSELRLNIEEYILYVCRIRLSTFVFLVLSGCTKYRKFLVGGFVVWTGFSLGLILTTAILKMKLQGLLFCVVSILPHFVCYAAAYLMLIIYYLQYPGSRWNGSKTICLVLFVLLGIITECYINPVIVDVFIGKI